MTTYAAAHRQRQAILTYWRRQGKDPNVWVERQEVAMSDGGSVETSYCVRSDMRDGQPRNTGAY